MTGQLWRNSRQRGVALILTLIILAIMTLGAVGLMRSVDTSNLIAGNLAFRQSAMMSAQVGVETATAWLENNRAALINNAGAGTGYLASWGAATGPAGAQTWQDYWNGISGNARTLAVDASGNTVAFVIQRMCPNTGALPGGPARNGCAYTVTTACPGGSRVAGGPPGVARCYMPHYRVTVRVAGPRNTVSFLQTIVAL